MFLAMFLVIAVSLTLIGLGGVGVYKAVYYWSDSCLAGGVGVVVYVISLLAAAASTADNF